MSRLVLAVRARIYRDGLASTLAQRPALEVAAAEADLAGAIAAAGRYQPDALLFDISMGGALEAVSRLQQASASTKLIALGLPADSGDELLAWAEAGAMGFVTCDNTLDELVDCVHSVLDGELSCSPRISSMLLRRVAQLARERSPYDGRELSALTPRQTRILQLLRMGQSNKQIARELGIELATVKNHVHNLLQRLQLRHRHEAASVLLPADRWQAPSAAPR